MVEGFLHKLLNTKDKTYWPMLSLCDIHIIPMLNPDGVVAGNSRCNFGGVDMNRRWGDRVLKSHVTPEITLVKDYLLSLGDKVSMYFDLQAHTYVDGLTINASQGANLMNKIKKDEAVDGDELDNWFL
jgi:murein tripeptide amidase MpaA